MPSQPATVCVVDDYDIIVEGTASLLAPHDDLVRLVGPSTHEGPDHHVDVALLDCFALPDNGAAIIGALTRNPKVGCVVIYAWNRDPSLIDAAMASGAVAYLSKGLPGRDLALALATAARGEPVVRTERSASEPGDTDLDGDSARRWPGQDVGLSERESEVLALITQGEPTKDIADTLFLGVNTVKTHIKGIYRKIGVKTRSAAVLWGVDHGFRPDRSSTDDWST